MGVLLVDKPAGPTSHDVVAVAKRAFGGVKAGHAGTLDPFATGLLVLGTGRATRLLEYLVGLDKEYEAVARLGAATDTHDHLGEVVSEDDRWRQVDQEQVQAAARELTGELSQRPPSYSAVKVRGVPAHRRVRRGEDVHLAPRTVTVRSFDVLAAEPPELRFRVACTSGTYVRSLAAALGDRLGTGCHLTALRRTRVGAMRVEAAASLDSVKAGRPPPEAWIAPADALAHLPRVEVAPEAAAKLAGGQAVAVESAAEVLAVATVGGAVEQLAAEGSGGAVAESPAAGSDAASHAGAPIGPVVALGTDGALVAVGTLAGGTLKPRKVFLRG